MKSWTNKKDEKFGQIKEWTKFDKIKSWTN